jgi:hypothetical protein
MGRGNLLRHKQKAFILSVSDPRFHGDEFTPAKAGGLSISDFRPKAGRLALFFSAQNRQKTPKYS